MGRRYRPAVRSSSVDSKSRVTLSTDIYTLVRAQQMSDISLNKARRDSLATIADVRRLDLLQYGEPSRLSI